MKPEPDPVSNLKARVRPEPENFEPVTALLSLYIRLILIIPKPDGLEAILGKARARPELSETVEILDLLIITIIMKIPA